MAFILVPALSPRDNRASTEVWRTGHHRYAFNGAKASNLRASVATSTETKTEPSIPVSPAPPVPHPVDNFEVPQPPGYADDLYFGVNDSVRFWRTYVPAVASNLPEHIRQITSLVTSNPANVRYWFHTLSRLTFLTTALNGVKYLQTDKDSNFGRRRSSARAMVTSELMLLDQALHTLIQDYENVTKGTYKLPWDLTLQHSSQNIFSVLKLLGTISKMFQRQRKNMLQSDPDISVWLQSSFYPSYYKQTYHFQADGWMSSDSANIYDFQTELFFVGLQDAMERNALCTMSPYIRETKSPRNLKIVEVAAGTGRFATFTRDNWPEADYVISDLSPFYLQKARENMSYWEKTQGRKYKNLGSVQYIHAAGENLPLPSASADILYAVYVFHELPPEARRAVIDEAARVLKPGGLFVFTDSVQRGDRKIDDTDLSSFGDFNEPWYRTYVDENFGDVVCSSRNFEPYLKDQIYLSKTLSFKRTS